MPTINFFRGHPTRRLLPSSQISDAYTQVLEKDFAEYDVEPNNQHPLTYGTDQGNLDARRAIADWNNRAFQIDGSNAQNINLTGGSSVGITNILLSTTTTDFTQRVFVVSPTYFLINTVFVDAGLGDKLSAICETPGADYEIDVSELEKQLKLYSTGLGSRSVPLSDHKYYTFVMYMVPTFSNPGGVTYSQKTRVRLLELARKYDMLLISDDVYELLDYTTDESPPIPRINYTDLASLAPGEEYGHTISNATFSKIVAPGMRAGWQECATPKLAKQMSLVGCVKSGGTPGQLSTVVIQHMLEQGVVDNIVDTLKATYSERSKRLQVAAKNYLPKCTTIYGGDGGYFLWVTIHDDLIDQVKVNQVLLERHDVILAGGENFEVRGDPRGWGRNCVRLCISYLEVDDIEKGLQLWGEVLREMYPHLYLVA